MLFFSKQMWKEPWVCSYLILDCWKSLCVVPGKITTSARRQSSSVTVLWATVMYWIDGTATDCKHFYITYSQKIFMILLSIMHCLCEEGWSTLDAVLVNSQAPVLNSWTSTDNSTPSTYYLFTSAVVFFSAKSLLGISQKKNLLAFLYSRL